MRLLEALYIKVFVNIVLTRTQTIVCVEYFSKGSVTDNFIKEFDTLNVDEKLVEYIYSFTKVSPYFYISFLDTSSAQGAMPTCLKTKMNLYHDISDCEYKCHNKQWTCYTSKNDVYAIEKRYEAFGLDFLFSPFTVLTNFFSDKIDNPMAMYVLLQDTHVSVVVFEKSKLLYADFLDTEEIVKSDELVDVEELEDELEEELDISDGIDLDDLDAIEDLDDLESLDDFGDIEDLDSLDDIDEFSESEDVEEEFHYDEEAEESEKSESENAVNEDYKRFSLIQTSINNFYKDKKYSGDFLENIYVADSIGISSDFKRYFEEEMFMSVYVRKINLCLEVAELARAEVLS